MRGAILVPTATAEQALNDFERGAWAQRYPTVTAAWCRGWAVFPATTLQSCIVHLIRNSLDYTSWKDRKLLAAALRPFYVAASANAADRR